MTKIKDINQGDILAFKADDGKYKAILCTSTYIEKSPQSFTFAALTINKDELPTIKNVKDSQFYGIGNRKDEHFKYTDIELEKMWEVHPEVKPYFLGSYGLIIWRKDFMKFRDHFQMIGNLTVIDNLDRNGNGGVNASDWNYLRDFFNEKYKTILKERGQKPFRVQSIIK